jgi:hypothetical protein
VIERAMARKREDRFTSATEMQAALLEAASHIELKTAPRMLSDMPPLESSENSGTRRLTPSERVTLDDPDSLPVSRTERLVEYSDSESRRPTTEALLPSATKTLKTSALLGHTQASRSRRYALLLMAAGALIYTMFVLVQVRNRAGLPAERTAASSQVPATPSGAERAAPAAIDSSATARTRTVGSEDQVVEVVVGDASSPAAKAAEAPTAKPRPRNRGASKVRKAQGALRNLDF